MTDRKLLLSVLSCALVPCIALLAGCVVTPVEATMLVKQGAPEAAVEAESSEELAEAINGFGIELLGRVAEGDAAENPIISPVSVHAALSMTANGASGETEEQMRAVLRTDAIQTAEANAQWAAMLGELEDRGSEQTLEIANALWGNKTVTFKEAFIEADRQFFGAELTMLDFVKDDVAGAINKWAAKNTHGMVKRVVNEVPADAILYLANAVYFKGDWVEPFEANATEKARFTAADGSTPSVEMMNSYRNLPYYESKTLQATRLAYKGAATSYYVSLPREGVEMETALASLGGTGFSRIRESMTSEAATEVILGLPKLDSKMSTSIKPALSDMGMPAVFDSQEADFSAMAEQPQPIWIDEVSHHTAIKVDEEGTEAAAVTIVQGIGSAGPSPTTAEIRCDRPYLFAIVDEASGAMLFLGVVNDPTK